MDANGEICLSLGLGVTQSYPQREIPRNKNERVFFLDLSTPNYQGVSSLEIIEQEEKQGSKEDDEVSFSMNFGRKKLRLSRDQTTLLEDCFKQHTTLNMAQKMALAEKLNLKPRQVEVWFQNRRARTKLKQTEVECEFLKKNCERLSDENWRLKKELIELRSSLKIDKPQPSPPPATTMFFRRSLKAAAREKNELGKGSGVKQEAAEAEAAVSEMVHET